MQFDVYVNPVPRLRRDFPYVAVLQHDLAVAGNERVVAFLAPHGAMSAVRGRVAPIAELEGRPFVLLLPLITNVPANRLATKTGSVAPYRDAIVQALDWLFLGI